MKSDPVINRRQQGAILVISLVLLTIMSLFGVTAMQSTIMQERMAGNTRDLNLAFEAAEAAEREGENWLSSLTAMPNSRACNTGICLLWDAENGANALFQTSGANFYTDAGLWANARDASFANRSGVHSAGSAYLQGVYNTPKFVIEFIEHRRDTRNLGQQRDLRNARAVFRITSRGTGGTDTAQAFVQSTFARRF